jgi:arginine-tRNA-protein transferase
VNIHGAIIDAGPCPYLPDRRFHAFHVMDELDPALYRVLLDNRFRRNGGLFYAPACPACTACQPIRVDIERFRPRRDQRRCLARNADLTVTWQPRGLDDERLELWRRYQAEVHNDHDGSPPERFLCEAAGVDGGELHARDAENRLLGVAVCDLVADVWSSVYCYYDPAERDRALGTFLALAEITAARERGLRWWYSGFWVAGCAKMAYKARFGPAEVLTDGRWIAMPVV